MEVKIERSSLYLEYSFGLRAGMSPILSLGELKEVSYAKTVLNRAQAIFESVCRTSIPTDFSDALAWPESPFLHLSDSRSERNGLICVAFKCVLAKNIFTQEQVKMLYLMAKQCINEASDGVGTKLEFQGAIVMIDSHAEFTPTDLS